MGAAKSVAGRALPDELTEADAKRMVPAGAWDDRWDAQFACAKGAYQDEAGRPTPSSL